MPSEALRATRGIRSNRSTASRSPNRLFAAMLVFTLVLAFPSPILAEYIFVDPGHGGKYPGAVCDGIRESDVNLLIALEVRIALAAQGHRVGMTRTSDVRVGASDRPTWNENDTTGLFDLFADGQTGLRDDLQARVDLANTAGADLFISIHNNAAENTVAQGTETYSNWDNTTDTTLSRELASLVQEEIVRNAGTYDRGIKEVGFYVIRWANMPAILVEAAFLSNSADRALLLTPSFRQDVARGIALGVQRFLDTDPFQPLYPRIAGRDRYATAAEIAYEGWPGGADTVFLASGVTWPDALSATPLAARIDAPILLARPDGLPEATAWALADLAPSEIVLLGGEGALASAVATAAAQAASLDVSHVRRIAGEDRYGTAVAIAEELGASNTGEVFVVTGHDFPDALSAAAKAGADGSPIILACEGLTKETRTFLEAHAPEIDTLVIMGGAGVLGDALAAEMAAAASAAIVRVSGPNRYSTNLAAIETFWPSGTIEPYVARATDFPDALVAGVLAARRDQPIMLVGTTYLPAPTREMLMHEADRISGFTMVGGAGAVSTLMEWEIQKAMRR